MSLGYPNQNGGRTTDAALFHALGNIFKGSWVSGFKVRQGSPLGMSVRIGGESNTPDDLLVKDGAGATFPVSNMSTQPVVATVATANSANPRIDSVVVYIDSAVAANHTAANNQNRTKVAVVSGAPATSPSAPSASQIKAVVGSNSPYVVLADIRVNRGVTSISDANITDRREAVRLNHAPVISDSAQLANDIVLPRHIKLSEFTPGAISELAESAYADINSGANRLVYTNDTGVSQILYLSTADSVPAGRLNVRLGSPTGMTLGYLSAATAVSLIVAPGEKIYLVNNTSNNLRMWLNQQVRPLFKPTSD